MATAPVFMLRTVATDGTLEQFLPDFNNIDMSPVYCDAGTVQFSYPEMGVNYGLLKEDIEIAVTMNGVEIPELRSLIETIEGDDAADNEKGASWKFTARTAVGKLDDAIVYPSNWVDGQVLKKPKQVSFSSKNMGFILNDLFSRAKSRGALAKYTWDFNASHDSEGNAWTFLVDVTFDIGKTYLDILKELAQNGWLEFKVEGRLIRVWDYNKMGVDRSIGPSPLHFRKGRDVRESPRKVNTKGLKTYTLVSGGDNTVFQEIHDPNYTVYGRRESYYSAGSLKYRDIWGLTSTLALAGNQYLSGVSDPQMEVNHGLHFETEDNPRPITNFNIGDWALTDVGKGVERFRILQWVMSVAADGSATGSITMNWLFNTQLSQVNSALNKLENGTTNAGSAPKNDGVAPAQVGGVSPSSSNYFVNNVPRSTLTIPWTAVTSNEDGSDIFDLDYYQVSWKYTSDGSAWRATLRVEAEDNQNVVQINNLDPGASVQVRVRAVDYWNNFGDWSAISTLTLAGDTIAPVKPAAPTVTSNVGTLRVTWTGLDYLGNAMPPDLAGVEVHVSNADFTPSTSTKKDVLPPGVLATTLTQGLSYGTEYWVKLVAFDTTGNRSAPSDTGPSTHVVLKQVVATEIGSGQVGLSQVSFSDVGNLVEDGSFENADIRTARNNRMTGLHFAFDATTSSNGTYSLRSDPWAGTANESILLQGSLPVKAGERVFGACDYRQTPTVPANSYLTLAIRWLDKNNSYVDSQGLQSNVFYTLSDNGFAAAKDNNWYRRVSNVSAVAPSNAVNFEIWLIGQSRTAGTIWVDAIEVRKQIDTLLISNAAITRALIADLAVNDAKIQDLNVGKLRTGTLQADITVSARIKTSDDGARVELNDGGIQTYSIDGTRTVDIKSADGSVDIIGNLRSGTSGRRIDINPGLLPEIRFYATSGSSYATVKAYDNSNTSGAVTGIEITTGAQASNGVVSTVAMDETVATFGRYKFDLTDNIYYAKGGFTRADDSSIRTAYFSGKGGNYGGSFWARSDLAEIGWFGSNTSNWNSILFSSDGYIYMKGTFHNYDTMSSNAAVFTGSVGWSSANGVILGYGITMDSLMIPVACGYYSGSNSPSFYVDSRSTTGFGFHSTVSVTATAQFWCFRV